MSLLESQSKTIQKNSDDFFSLNNSEFSLSDGIEKSYNDFYIDENRKFNELSNPIIKENSENVKVDNPLTKKIAYNFPYEFIYRYVNDFVIDNAIKTNPMLVNILKENNLSLEYNLDNVFSIIKSHLVPTANLTKKIYERMGHNFTEDNYICLIQAALLHDIGKVFIPSEILNKKGKLSQKEREIVELHIKIGSEILKTTDLNKKVAQYVFEHHNYSGNLKRTEENQAITIADVYCALREKRSYKNSRSDLCAKAIMYDMGTMKNAFDPKYISYIN